MNIQNRVISLLLISTLISGCATVFGRHQDDQTVTFDTNAKGAEITCSGKRAMLPGSIPLKQSKNATCEVMAPGYEKKVITVKSGMSWSGFGASTGLNAFGGLVTLGIWLGVGWIVDAVSGSMKNLKEDNIYIELKPLPNVNP